MALGGIILFLWQQNNVASTVSPGLLLSSNDAFSFEFRVKFPGPTNEDLAPTVLSGALVTLHSGALGASYVSLWYEKESATATTGNIYLTSSAGRLQLTSASIFNDDFYNLAVVKDKATGSITLHANRHEDGGLVYSTSSVALSGAAGFPINYDYSAVVLGSTTLVPSTPQFWGHEFRVWSSALSSDEIIAHSAHFESYGRDLSYNNRFLKIHWRLNEGVAADSAGKLWTNSSAISSSIGTGSNFVADLQAYDKFLEQYSYIPSYDYGWNQKKIRTYDSYKIDPEELYHDERFVSLEMNMIDALNEDISHIMSSYDEINDALGLPLNRYRQDYERLGQMRETYFKRLQDRLNFRIFADMLDFFDRSFVPMIEKLLPARALFNGDEFVVESHMLERPKYQYNIRPIVEGPVDISGTIAVLERPRRYA